VIKTWVLVGAAVVAMAAGCTPAADRSGRESKESLVKAYLTALQAGDAGAMLSLVGPRVDARSDVADAIQQGGGKELKDVTVSYLDEFGGTFIVATVNGLIAGDGSPFQTTLPVVRENGRYYLALGQATPTGSESDTASPSAVP